MLIKIVFKSFGYLLLLVGLAGPLSSQTTHQKFTKVKELAGIEEYLYEPNGMKILLMKDNSAPVVTVQVVYHVGSKHEVTGNTGSAHLLEHLTFKGTPTFNKKNGNSILNVLQGIGAHANATTWYDRTNYYEIIPSDKLELALHIESDRMRNCLLLKEDKDAEMTVVRNEFERGENTPRQVLDKQIWATAYMAHPYHHSTIGWRSDIEKMPIEVLRDFYNTYYWPNNATLTIIGDFQKDNLFGLVDKYFGKITKSPHDIPQLYTEEPTQLGPRKIVIKKPGQQAVLAVAYKIPGRMHEDLPPLTVLGQILGSGTNSILNKTFIDSKKAMYAYASPSYFQEVGLFNVGLDFAPTSSHDDLKKELLETLEVIKKEGVKQEDVDRIVAKLNAKSILSKDGSGSITYFLTGAIAGGDWTDYVTGYERLSKVTAADVKRVANKYLVEDQSTTGYFVPQMPGANKAATQKAANYIENQDSKQYYRNPLHDHKAQNVVVHENQKTEELILPEYPKDAQSSPANREFTRKKVSGIDVITTKTGAKGFVTVSASLPIGSYFNTNGNDKVPTLTAQMLSRGTTKNNKFAFSQKLEKLGVDLRVGSRGQKINIDFKCLKEDVPQVIHLLAEELRYPLFDAEEFDILKSQMTGNVKRALSNPDAMAQIALSQAIYPEGHPNYIPSVETYIKNLEAATLEDIKAFHKKYLGPKGMHLVAVGDIDTKVLHQAIRKSFHNWKGGVTGKATYSTPKKVKGTTKVVTIPEKPSAAMYIGQYTGIQRSDADYLPFYIGTSILGGDFSGRLMQTVRDRDGLTYGIYSSHTGHTYAGGHWLINGSFNPNLFQKGLDATMVELKKWVDEGITAKELAMRKTNLTGNFKLSMSTTHGLADRILGFVERGLTPNYIDQYSKDIEAVSLKQVNNAIKKHIDLNKLIIIKSGSLDQDGKPLKK